MNLDHIPQSIQLALALVGGYHLLDKTWIAITTFYFQRKMMVFQNTRKDAPEIGPPPEFHRQEIESMRRHAQHEYTHAIIQLMKVDGYTLPIAQNAAIEIFEFTRVKAEEKYPL